MNVMAASWTRRLVGAALWTLMLLASGLSAHAVEIEVGQPFPDLALRTLDGDVSRVSDYRGQKLILHVFASW